MAAIASSNPTYRQPTASQCKPSSARKGAAIVGATSTTYTTPATFAANTGEIYSVVVSNIAGSATSAPAILTVATPPTITLQPVGSSVTLGKTATFTVAATGTGPLTYQWYDGANPVSGATSPTYTTPATATTDNGSVFTVVVSNPAGSATSLPATLTVNTPPTITVQPTSQSAILGKTATFTVTATGSAPLSYQWSLGGTAIGGATSASYTTPATVAANSGGLYTVVVTNPAGTVTSSSATLTVLTPPTITVPPASTSVTAGQTATFSVTATGSAPLAYQWSLGGTAVAGATSASYTTPATTLSSSGGLYTVAVSNAAGSVTSSAATLTVTSGVATLSCTPASPTYGATVTLVPTFGAGTAVIGSTGLSSSDITKTAVSGTSYISPAIKASTTYTLTVTSGSIVTSATCTVAPSTVALTPITPANQTTGPVKQVFATTATGGLTNTVNWTATGGTMSAGTWTPPNAAGTYTITATSVDNPSVSASTTATISIPVITTFPISQKVCLNGSATLTAAAGYASSYQWSLNGANISGATTASLLIPNAIAIDSGT